MPYKVVLVEDENLLLKALNMQLLNNGFEVLSARDGASGLRLIEKEKPDIVRRIQHIKVQPARRFRWAFRRILALLGKVNSKYSFEVVPDTL